MDYGENRDPNNLGVLAKVTPLIAQDFVFPVNNL